jgi:hypothetical protein
MKACRRTITAEVCMKKNITAMIIAAGLILTGCGIRLSNSQADKDPFDSDFKDAHEFAEYWCGPCEEVGSYEVGEYTIHEMKDDEFGFVYEVEEVYLERGEDTGLFDVSYSASQFGYYYLQRFIEETDLDDNLAKYGITLDCGELSYYKTMDVAYYGGAKLNVSTEMTLTDEEAAEIMASVKAELADFDERGYFTKSANTNSPEVYIVIWSAPWEQDTANGSNYHTWTEMYGYTMGFYQE